MGKSVKKPRPAAEAAAPSLAIGLSDPGMTPVLRAGLGGLAASLRAILLEAHPEAAWPGPVQLGQGSAVVERRKVILDWGGRPFEETLRPLFELSFRTSERTGLIELPGARGTDPPTLPLSIQLQEALKKTFLQHGKSTSKAGAARTATFEVDGRRVPVQYQPYETFAHQSAWECVVQALPNGTVELAGWAYPGAVQRHIGFAQTKWEYSAGAALSACFALVGCISYTVPSVRGGAIVVPEPSDLIRFARSRGGLGPSRPELCAVGGVGDAVLTVALALRAESAARDGAGVSAATGVLLQSTPWASQQKNRTSTASAGNLPESVLDQYDKLAKTLPTRIRVSERKGQRGGIDKAEQPGEGIFITTSTLRAFVAENLARGLSWYDGFATAKAGVKKDLFVHYYKDRDNLGALYPEERKGLTVMVESLEGAERSFIRSVHAAMRARFGAIASESSGVPATMKNRFGSEREKWRLAFSGAKTPEQIRAALADLWSRGGSNAELRENWESILPLLRPERWQEARDLALVALASYQGQRPEEDEAVTA
jgi:CRISPR-associated protein Cas8a1/Csx13